MIRVIRNTYDSPKGMTREVFKIDDSKKMNIYIDGELYSRQVSDFKVFKEDFNRDNVIYEMYGAYFNEEQVDVFYTPDELVDLITKKNAVIEYI